jgi:uncharacterized protein (TIGR03905 family)
MHYQEKLELVCSKEVSFDVNEGAIYNVQFKGGCPGNLKAIGLLINGMPVNEVITKLQGNLCGDRKTSCVDQLTKVLKKIHE